MSMSRNPSIFIRLPKIDGSKPVAQKWTKDEIYDILDNENYGAIREILIRPDNRGEYFAVVHYDRWFRGSEEICDHIYCGGNVRIRAKYGKHFNLIMFRMPEKSKSAPRPVEHKHADQRSVPRPVEHKHADQRSVPRPVEHKSTDQRSVPRPVEHKSTDQRSVPRPVEHKSSAPRPVEHKSSAPKHHVEHKSSAPKPSHIQVRKECDARCDCVFCLQVPTHKRGFKGVPNFLPPQPSAYYTYDTRNKEDGEL